MTIKVSTTDVLTGDTILAATVSDLLTEAGIDVDRFVASSGEARRISSVHEGIADLSVGLAPMLRWAYRSEAAYDGWRQTSMRALVSLSRPAWFALAAPAAAGAGSLADVVAANAIPRVLAYPPDGHSAGWVHTLGALLGTAGARLADLKAAGSFVDPTTEPRIGDEIELVALPYGTPGVDELAWARAHTALDLRPLEVDGLDRVADELGFEVRQLPTGGLLPATTTALYAPRTVVFASERLDDGIATTLVAALHDHRDRLLAEGFLLDPTAAFDPQLGVRYHRAAIAYYRDAGVLPQPA